MTSTRRAQHACSPQICKQLLVVTKKIHTTNNGEINLAGLCIAKRMIHCN